MDLALNMTVSAFLGVVVAVSYMHKNSYTKSFITTLVILPLLVEFVIMMVNGNVGTGVAVMGAFSLIRFRSVPGGAKEMLAVFWSMAIGIATGMSYLTVAIAFTVAVSLLIFCLNVIQFGNQQFGKQRLFKITIAEDLDYPEIFEAAFSEFTSQAELVQVRTTNMGSMYELRYLVKLNDLNDERKLMDSLRIENGNLPIISSKNIATNEL